MVHKDDKEENEPKTRYISSQNKKDGIETISIQREYYYWQNDNRHNMEHRTIISFNFIASKLFEHL